MNRYITHYLKKYSALACAAVLILQARPAYAAIYYQKGTQETVAHGITYEDRVQATSAGLINVSVLYVDITNEDIEIRPIQSATNYGGKETVSQMVLESGAMAGVNADFFDMNISPSTPFGDVVINNQIVSMDINRPGYTTFFIDEDNNPFIEYIEPQIKFLNNGQHNIKVHAMNKYLRDFTAVYFDRNAIANTAELDAKFPELVKFVVDDGVITYVSAGGETVDVPENGFIILCAATYAQYFYESVKVGDTAEIKVEAHFDYEKMQTAIGGAGKILEAGAYSNYGYVVSPNSRQPRTALGVTQDGSRLILAVVDGRGHSVGATHEEMAEIMQGLGAWNAMHFDGGGSSTLVADTNYDNSLQVKNSPSGGSQRRVVNGLGVFHNAPVGEATNLLLTVSDDKVFFGNPVTVNASGLDANNKKTTLPENAVTFYSEDAGRWEGNKFYPEKYGPVVISAMYNDAIEQIVINNMDLAQIVPNHASIKLAAGDSTALRFEGISVDGVTAPLTNVVCEVVPAELGTISADNRFTAGASGITQGYIKCVSSDVTAYIGVSIGTKTEYITGFNQDRDIEFVSSGDSVKGSVSYDDSVNNAGNYALKLSYQFSKSTSTQAAYLKFSQPILFADGLNAFEIAVHGNGDGGWVRARLVDGAGQEHLVDVAKDITFTGWSSFTVKIPDEASQPVSLERLYVAHLSNDDVNAKSIYFDDLRGHYPADFSDVDVPASDRFNNPYEASLSADKQKEHIDLTFVGDIIIHDEEDRPSNYTQLQENALKRFVQTADARYFAGPSDLETVDGITRSNGYKFTLNGNYAIIEMSAKNGSLSSTYPGNWIFVNEAKASPASHIIILTDRKPENYSTTAEYELFRTALRDLRTSGKNVFVISTSGFDSSSKVMDGVNYINLGALFNLDNSINKNFRTLRIRINGEDIAYELQEN